MSEAARLSDQAIRSIIFIMIRVILPFHLRTLGHLEARYPMLRGAITTTTDNSTFGCGDFEEDFTIRATGFAVRCLLRHDGRTVPPGVAREKIHSSESPRRVTQSKLKCSRYSSYPVARNVYYDASDYFD